MIKTTFTCKNPVMGNKNNLIYPPSSVFSLILHRVLEPTNSKPSKTTNSVCVWGEETVATKLKIK